MMTFCLTNDYNELDLTIVIQRDTASSVSFQQTNANTTSLFGMAILKQ